MSALTKEQIEMLPELVADATPAPWAAGPAYRSIISGNRTGYDDEESVEAYGGHMVCESVKWDANARLIALAPSLAATVIEQQAEIERLRGLLWYAWNEFNAIRARSGAPLDHYQMTTVSPEWWETMLEAFGEAIGDENQKPWPSPAARAALDVEP